MKVVSVKHLDTLSDVFGVSINNNSFDMRNFILSNGVVSHNTDLQDLTISRFGTDGLIVHADASQMEVRVLAAMSKDPALLAAFASGADIHRMIAAGVWNKRPEDVSDAERRFSKMGCVVGSTKIKLLDGTSKTIKDMYDSSVKEYYVHSFDTSNKNIKSSNTCDIQLTKYVDKTIKITFSNGGSLECTHDHPILTYYGGYKEASELVTGELVESIIPEVDSVDTSNLDISSKYLVIEEIKEVTYDKPIPVYDLSVDIYHNYAVDVGDNYGVFVHNTFSILYGKSVNGFAREFMGGDYSRAEELFTSFYTAYPGVRDFITKKHTEAVYTGYVQTLFGDYIEVGMPEYVFSFSKELKDAIIKDVFSKDINLSNKSRHEISKALRNAQNYPIQGSASNITALSIEELSANLKKRNYKSRVFGFTHDSQDADTKIVELLSVIEMIYEASVTNPTKAYGVPMKIDLGIGCSGNEVIELGNPKITNSKLLETSFEGTKSAFESVRDRLKNHSSVKSLTYEYTKEYTSRVEMKELFITRRAYSLSIGKDIDYVKGSLVLEMN